MSTIRGTCCLLLTCLSLSHPLAHAGSIEQLTRTPMITGIEISPDGRHLAARMLVDDKHSLVFLNRETLQVTGGLRFRDRSEVGAFQWANDERVVGEVWVTPLTEERPYFYGELFATNSNGSHSEWLYGYRSGEMQAGTRIKQKQANRAWARIIDVLPDEQRFVLISSTRWTRSQGAVPEVIKLNIYSGREQRVAVPASRSASSFFTGPEGNIRIITGMEDDGSLHVQASPAAGKWVEIDASVHGEHFTPWRSRRMVAPSTCWTTSAVTGSACIRSPWPATS